jgi:hypothetical protein
MSHDHDQQPRLTAPPSLPRPTIAPFRPANVDSGHVHNVASCHRTPTAVDHASPFLTEVRRLIDRWAAYWTPIIKEAARQAAEQAARRRRRPVYRGSVGIVARDRLRRQCVQYAQRRRGTRYGHRR